MRKRVTTRAVYDIESGRLLERQSYFYDGPWELATPASLKGEDDAYWYGDFYLGHVVQGIVAATAAAVLTASLVGGGIPLREQNEIVPQPIPIQDEDFWQNPVAPVPSTFRRLDPATFEQHDPAGSLFLPTLDEDYWQNPVAPLTLSFQWPNPFQFEQHEVFVVPVGATPVGRSARFGLGFPAMR